MDGQSRQRFNRNNNAQRFHRSEQKAEKAMQTADLLQRSSTVALRHRQGSESSDPCRRRVKMKFTLRFGKTRDHPYLRVTSMSFVGVLDSGVGAMKQKM